MFLTPYVRQQFFDSNGDPLSSGKVYTYLAGTTTPASTYTDANGGTPNANPVILDSAGVAAIWIGAEALKFVIKTSADVTVQTIDNITASPITTRGDLIIGGVSGVMKRLAKGTEGYVLQMGANEPEWAAKPDLRLSAAKTTNYTLLLSDDFVRFDATSGALTATFPSATTSTNKVLIVKKTDSSFNAVTLSGTGMTTNYLMTVGETAAYVSDGTNWVQLWRKTNTDRIAYTPVLSATGGGSPAFASSPVTNICTWQREGNDIVINLDYYHTSNGGAVAGTDVIQFSIPNSTSWTIDSSKKAIPSSNVLKTSVCGSASYSGTTSAQSQGVAFVSTNNKIFITGGNETTSGAFASTTQPLTDAVVQVSFTARVPITNFSA